MRWTLLYFSSRFDNICGIINDRWMCIRLHSDLPQRLSLWSSEPGLMFAIVLEDATGGRQVYAGLSGPWWCCDHCCTTMVTISFLPLGEHYQHQRGVIGQVKMQWRKDKQSVDTSRTRPPDALAAADANLLMFSQHFLKNDSRVRSNNVENLVNTSGSLSKGSKRSFVIKLTI